MDTESVASVVYDPNSDIGILFQQNIRLEGDKESIKKMLHQNGITTLGMLNQIQEQDLTAIGISFRDAQALLKKTR
jgi:mevalonate kinase